MPGAVPAIPRLKFTNNSGDPVVSGSVTVYLAGGTTLATTYQDKALTIQSQNPVPLDANAEALFWLDPSLTYKFLLKDSSGVPISGWPVDNILTSGPAPTLQQSHVDTFSGNGVQTAFTLTSTPGSINDTNVYVAGVYQKKTAYTLAGNVLTFVAAPASGSLNIEVNYYVLLDFTTLAATISGYSTSASASANAAAGSATEADAAASAAVASASMASDSAAAAAASEASAAAMVDGASSVLGSMGYEVPVAYVAALSMARPTQTVSYSGQTYAPILSQLPFTTSGTFETAKFRLIQGVSGPDLAANSGASIVGTSTGQTVEQRLANAVTQYDLEYQTYVAFTSGGTGTAYTLTPSPPAFAYNANLSYFVKFNVASGDNPTLQISGLTSPPHLVKQNFDGSYSNILANDIPANHRSQVTLLSPTQALVQDLPRMPLSAQTSAIGRNRIVNGAFGVNQRAVSGTVTLGAGAYGHDRWKAGASGCTYTFSTTANVTTLTISAGSLQQVIEGVNLQSGTHVLSWTGTAQGKIAAGAYSASGVTGTATGGTNLTVEFNTGTLSNVQFEPGTAATPFAWRPYAMELEMCQRYYEIGAASCLGSAPTAGAQIYTRITYKVTKRATPTFGVGSVAANTNTASTTQYDGNTDSTGYYAVSSATGLVEYRFAWTASSEL